MDNEFDRHRTDSGGDSNMGIELIVFATVFTLLVLLTGGPGPGSGA